jgi:hypothetical protein
MEGVGRLDYATGEVAGVESDVAITVKQTITQGLNNGGVLSFRLAADPERFTDLSTILLRLELGIKDDGGADVNAADSMMIDAGGMHSLFSSCDVRFNDQSISVMTSYPYTTALSRTLGTSKDVREGVWDNLDGTWDWGTLTKSSFAQANFPEAVYGVRRRRVQNDAVLIGKIYSDILMSCRQYLPPGVALGIDLRRAQDRFSLLSSGDTTDDFKVHIKSASIYVRRLHLQPSLTNKALAAIKEGGAGLTYNRLETRIMSIKAGTRVFQWHDCLNNAPLPNRIYIGFVAQAAFYGHFTQISTYFENLKMTKLNVKLNGRDVLVEPIMTTFPKVAGATNVAECNGMEGFLSILEATNQINDPTAPIRLHYANYLLGNTLFAIELGKCGEKHGSAGALDLEFAFEAADMDACILLFTERTETAQIFPRGI